MKYVWLFAIVVVLGASCKKEVNVPVKTETVKGVKKADIRWDLPGTTRPPSQYDQGNPLDESTWGYPNNPTTFPHNTGACTCGMYASCHPSTYFVTWYDSHDMGHQDIFQVKPGQVKFPEGATFAP